MDLYTREQHEMRGAIERLALRHKTWTDHVAAMSSFIEATHSHCRPLTLTGSAT